jgi:hypothetical protein
MKPETIRASAETPRAKAARRLLVSSGFMAQIVHSPMIRQARTRVLLPGLPVRARESTP